MQDLYWIGVKESDIEGCNQLYKGSLTILGSGENGNISYSSNKNERINHNSDENEKEVNEWLNSNALKILANNPNAKFMFYNQEKIFEYDEAIIENTICYNSKELINSINNKFLMREWLKNYVPILQYQYDSGIEILSESSYIEDNKQFVVQSQNSNGGSNTFLLNKQNFHQIEENIKQNEIYSVSEYCENNIPINIHCIISKEQITLFPLSIQIIKSGDRMSSRGSDFMECRKIKESIKNKVKKYSLAICEQLQKIGYTGILGIDYIIHNEEVYFMEINPRFQSSTNLLNMALKENEQETVNELCMKAFKNEDITSKEIDVNYSKYIFEEDDMFHELKIPCIKKQKDGFDEKQSIKKGAYKYSCIYNERICQIIDGKFVVLK